MSCLFVQVLHFDLREFTTSFPIFATNLFSPLMSFLLFQRARDLVKAEPEKWPGMTFWTRNLYTPVHEAITLLR